MQNLFYVPPYLGDDLHPKPLGIRTAVKRNYPTRLDLSQPHPGLVQFDLSADIRTANVVTTKPARFAGLRKWISAGLIRMGHALAPDETTPLGQPV